MKITAREVVALFVGVLAAGLVDGWGLAAVTGYGVAIAAVLWAALLRTKVEELSDLRGALQARVKGLEDRAGLLEAEPYVRRAPFAKRGAPPRAIPAAPVRPHDPKRKARIINLPSRAIHAIALVALAATGADAGLIRATWHDAAPAIAYRAIFVYGSEGALSGEAGATVIEEELPAIPLDDDDERIRRGIPAVNYAFQTTIRVPDDSEPFVFRVGALRASGEDPNLLFASIESVDFAPADFAAAPPATLVWIRADDIGAGAEFSDGIRLETTDGALTGQALAFSESLGNANNVGAIGAPIAPIAVSLPFESDWFLWGRLLYEGSGNDANSFWVRVGGGEWQRLGNNSDQWGVWHWDGLGARGDDPLAPLPLGRLPAGPTLVEIARREVEPVAPKLELLALVSSTLVAPNDELARAVLVTPPTLPPDPDPEPEPDPEPLPDPSTDPAVCKAFDFNQDCRATVTDALLALKFIVATCGPVNTCGGTP